MCLLYGGAASSGEMHTGRAFARDHSSAGCGSSDREWTVIRLDVFTLLTQSVSRAQTADPNDDEGGPEMLKMRPRDFGQPIGKGRPFRQPHQVVLQLTLYSV
jgi:hypothetical protein